MISSHGRDLGRTVNPMNQGNQKFCEKYAFADKPRPWRCWLWDDHGIQFNNIPGTVMPWTMIRIVNIACRVSLSLPDQLWQRNNDMVICCVIDVPTEYVIGVEMQYIRLSQSRQYFSEPSSKTKQTDQKLVPPRYTNLYFNVNLNRSRNHIMIPEQPPNLDDRDVFVRESILACHRYEEDTDEIASSLSTRFVA